MKLYPVKKVNYQNNKTSNSVYVYNISGQIKEFVKEEKFIKWTKTDRALQFIMNFHEVNKNNYTKAIYWNPYRHCPTTLIEVSNDSNLTDWKCAICQADIISMMENFSIKNLVCDKCGESHHKKNESIDSRIINSSRKFSDHCNLILKKDQKEFIHFTKKNSSILKRDQLKLS